MEEARVKQRAVDVALSVLAVGVCGWLVFDLLPAIQLALQALKG